MVQLKVVAQPVGGCKAGSCGAGGEKLSQLPEGVREKVFNHPCYSEQAHHHFARMHVAVAPACNIQCNYCNRKYDCANESRPGVVSEVLTPEQAARKTLAVAAAIPQMSVLGIAGPGDPLANPERTFETFRRVRAVVPDLKLCISTNGLALPENVERLAALDVDHVTITINCVDPAVGAQIYPWIFWQNRRLRGVKAAEILIAQQQKGLEMLVARGILVKVNSVLIPGVNDEHLKEVSRVVKAKGAFLHNVMPLIAAPEHGTYFGIMGQRSPTATEVQRLQDACAGEMAMMRHCRQCRADAVGLLGEDRGAEFTLAKIDGMQLDPVAVAETRRVVQSALAEKVKVRPESPVALSGPRAALIAVASQGGGLINQHFGHAREFLIYEASAAGVRFVGTRRADQYCTGAAECDEEEGKLERSVKVLEGCRAMLSARIGLGPWKALEAAGITPNSDFAMEPIETSVQAAYDRLVASGALATTPARVAATQ